MAEPSGRGRAATEETQSPRGGPTLLRLQLGAQLRRLREAQGISAEEAGYEIRGSQSKISRLEAGRVGFKERDVADLLTLYGVRDPSEREALLLAARQSNQPAWWHQFGEIIPAGSGMYIGLEEAATLLRCFEAGRIPDLLQIPEYSRAAIELARRVQQEAEVERHVALLEQRQESVNRPGGPRMWFVVDESALRRSMAGKDVMRAQLEHLIEVNKLHNVTLQIIAAATPLPVRSGSFVVLRFASQALPDVVYVEHLTGVIYFDRAADVSVYGKSFDLLAVSAEKSSATPAILSRVIADLES